jgi:hypothetical protein
MKQYVVIMFDEWIKYNSINDVSSFATKAANALNRSRDEILECIDGEIADEKANIGIGTSPSDDAS